MLETRAAGEIGRIWRTFQPGDMSGSANNFRKDFASKQCER